MTILSTRRGDLEIRELAGSLEMEAAEAIQVRVWGPDTTPHPKEILIPMQHVGGLVAGTFTSGGEMVGLVFGFPTRDPALMHSHLLATLPEWRGCGIGAAMKWFQRDWCLSQGITRVQWTVDPLRAANAELNIRRLGGISTVYYPDYYGPMRGIDAGAPSDRLLIDWELYADRVVQRAQRTPEDRGFADFEAGIGLSGEEIAGVHLESNSHNVSIRIPQDFIALAKENPQEAYRWRMETRAVFQAYLAKGYAIREFSRVGGPAYLLTKELDPHGMA